MYAKRLMGVVHTAAAPAVTLRQDTRFLRNRNERLAMMQYVFVRRLRHGQCAFLSPTPVLIDGFRILFKTSRSLLARPYLTRRVNLVFLCVVVRKRYRARNRRFRPTTVRLYSIARCVNAVGSA